LIGIFERQYKNDKAFTITGDGEQRRDFTHVDDIVDGLVSAADRSCILGEDIRCETFELGRGENYSVNEIAAVFDASWAVEYIDEKPGEMRETLCTDTKARDMLGWNPKRDVIDFIEENYILDK
jgi:UDP-glucose 4-epimerase